MQLKVLEILKSPHKGTVIWLHGLGDSALGWLPAMEEIQRRWCPTIRFVLPTAPIMPVTLNFGAQMTAWHDITSLSSIEDQEFRGIDQNLREIYALVEKEQKTGSVILGGFSQGAAMALAAGLGNSGEKVKGIAAFSGYLPTKMSELQNQVDGKFDIPVLLCHGTRDMVVDVRSSERTEKMLKELGMRNVQFVKFPGMGHSACDEELEKLARFIQGILS